MTFLKSFALNVLYFTVGITPVLVIYLYSQKILNETANMVLFFALFGFGILFAILVQKKLRKLGAFKLKDMSTYAALALMTVIFIVVIRQIS